MTRKDLEQELISLAALQAKRRPSILVQFVPPLDVMAVHPERKCTCKRPAHGIAFCYCLCGGERIQGEMVQ